MLTDTENLFEGYTFIDLFAGLGGFRLALESFGAECVFSSEIDEPARRVYTENFGEVPAGDITQIAAESVPDHDIICAGFPCQAFSISGKQRGFEDSRGTLFFDVARLIAAKQPKVVFLENVRNFATHDKGNTIRVVENTMHELGYSFHYKLLSAADYGVPQKRERIYMVGFRHDVNSDDFSFPKAFPLTQHVEDLLVQENSLVEHLYIDREDTQWNGLDDTTYAAKPIRLGMVNKGGQGERIYSTKGVGVTLSAHGGGVFAKTGGYLIDGRTRKLHPRECARLMGFPESYRMTESASQTYKQFGNSVVIDVLQHVLISINEVLNPVSAAE